MSEKSAIREWVEEMIERNTPKWQPGTPHPHCPNVIASVEEGTWIPALGYSWINRNNVKINPWNGKTFNTHNDFRVRWGSKHPIAPNVVTSEKEGLWKPDAGYLWEYNSNDNDITLDSLNAPKVKWVPGILHSSCPNVFAGIQEGSWKPGSGYAWLNPNDPNDFQMIRKTEVVTCQNEGPNAWDVIKFIGKTAAIVGLGVAAVTVAILEAGHNSPWFCVFCGQKINSCDRYCPHCGTYQ